MSAQQKEPASSNNDDESLDLPSSSCIPTKSEYCHDSKDLPERALEKDRISINEKGQDHSNFVEVTGNIVPNITNVDEGTVIDTEKVGMDNKNTLSTINEGSVPLTINQVKIGEPDTETKISENKTSDDDEEEIKLRWDDDSDEDQEKTLNEQETTKDQSSDPAVADKLSESLTPAVEELQNTIVKTSKEIENIVVDKHIEDHAMNPETTAKDKDILLEQKKIPKHIEVSSKDILENITETITETNSIDSEKQIVCDVPQTENKEIEEIKNNVGISLLEQKNVPKYTEVSSKDILENITETITEPKSIDSEKQIVCDVPQTETKEVEEIKINVGISEMSEQNNLDIVEKIENTTTKNDMSLGDSVKLKNSEKVITAMEVDLNKSDILSSTGSDSFLDDSIEKIEHGLNKPDMMLEIPTQEFVEFSDEDDENLDHIDEGCKSHSGSSIEKTECSANIELEKKYSNMETSGVIDVDMESSSVNSDIMLTYDDTDQSFVESKCHLNIETSEVIDVDMKSTSDNSEIMLKYDDSDQLLDENDDEVMNVDIPEEAIQDIEKGESEATVPNYVDDITLKHTITKLDEDIKNLTDEIEVPDDFDQTSTDKNLPIDDLVDKTLVDTIVAKLDEDIKNLTDEIEISDDPDLPLDESKNAKDLNLELEHPQILLMTEVENHDKVIEGTITKLDEDIKNLTDEIEVSDDLAINLDQPSEAKDLKLASLSISSATNVENLGDIVLRDTITELDIKNLTDEIEISDDFDPPSKTKDLIVELSEPLVLAQGESNLLADDLNDKILQDTIIELDESIKNLTDEIRDSLDANLVQVSKTEDSVQPPTLAKEKNLPNTSGSEGATLENSVTKLDEDIKNLTDEMKESKNEDVKSDRTSKPDDLKLELAQPSTSLTKDSLLETGQDDHTDVQPSTAIDQLVVQPSTSVISDQLEVQPSTSTASDQSTVKPSTSSDQSILQPSTSSDQLAVQPSTVSDQSAKPSTSTSSGQLSAQPSTSADQLAVQPSTSIVSDQLTVQPSISSEQLSAQPSTLSDQLTVQPSTSSDQLTVLPLTSSEQLDPDTTDEVPEVTDSLGLLAESSRVMEDDEEADEDDDGDDDDDFDQDDESSNQMTAEHSEDSNAQHSEPDTKDQDTPTIAKDEPDFTVGTITISGENKDPVLSDDADVKLEYKPEDDDEVALTTQVKSLKLKLSEEITDIETVKLSDTSDNEIEIETTKTTEILKKALLGDAKIKPNIKDESPSKLALDQPSEIFSIVDLDESSSEGDIQEISTPSEGDKQATADGSKPNEADSQVKTSEEPIKSTSIDEATPESKEAKRNSTFDLEVFNLDSDEEDTPQVYKRPSSSPKTLTALEMDKARESNKCINYLCESGSGATYVIADPATVSYYDAGRKRNSVVCLKCEEVVRERTKSLVKGIKELTPLLNLDMKVSSDLVEISDSDSEDEGDGDSESKERIGEIGAKFLEEQLADMINETWRKYRLDARLRDAQDDINKEMQMLEEESIKIDTMLNKCQVATDKLRNELYATFEPGRKELPAVGLVESNGCVYVIPERNESSTTTSEIETRAKRRMSSAVTPPAKRPAIPLGYTPLGQDAQDSKSTDQNKLDDDKDISVVKLSMESAPPDLPPTGEITRAPLRVGMSLYAMRNTFCSWLKVKITEVHPKTNNPSSSFTMCRVKFDRVKVNSRVLPARCLAYAEPADVRLTIGTRVIALFKESTTDGGQPKESFYSGIVAEIPNPVNKFRYLIFFDDGYAQYVKHCDTRVVCESASLVWEEVHPFSREFVRNYLLTYPERPMVRLHAGQSLKTEWNGKWWVSRVIQVDASLVQVHFEEDNRTEWIYRGSTRLAPLFLELQAAERQRARPMPRSNQRRMNMPYVEYTRSDEQGKDAAATPAQAQQQHQQNNEDIRRQRAVAKKSTVPPLNMNMSQPPPPPSNQTNLDSVTSRVVYYTPKNAVKPYKMVTHVCSSKCKRSDVLALKDLRTYNPLAKPLLSGWERQVVRFKGHKEVMYRAPCGRRLRNMRELHRYLQIIQSDMAVDLFDFHPNTHCLAEFVLNKCLVGKKDLSHGKENVPVPCVNYYDESLPEFCSYNTERTPTAGVPLNIDPDFLCGCDCQDDCEDKSKCACWKMTLEGARTIGFESSNVGYVYKRLPEPLPSGIYECNSRCKCRQTCLNRVAQHPLQLKLQVFKTYNRGWGIRALNDVPKGSFLCVYAGNLLTDATANLDGLNEGDEYLAELDYIEVVEQMKEGYEEDIPEADKKLDKAGQKTSSDEEETSTEEEDDNSKDDDKADDDFRPGFIGLGLTDFDKRLRKREKKERKNKAADDKEKESDEKKDSVDDNGCITISDDEEVREPSRFMAQTEMGANFISKHKSVRSYFGKDEACYIMDAKVQGNIGRYLNHSCTPNVFVQNVFVDTHDPRFPWVAFFALSHIRAGTELTWNYNYDIGSVPGKVLYCYCGAPNCRGRLL